MYIICVNVVADIISCVEFNADGELLATGDKGGRVVIFQRDQMVTVLFSLLIALQLHTSKHDIHCFIITWVWVVFCWIEFGIFILR